MKNPALRQQGFSLVELLVTIVIIGILLAILLPVLSRSQMRAKRVWCENNLHQTGIAFQSFAHDHNNKFPMSVGTANGGSLEFVQNGFLINGPFYFGFRHFQALSGYLGSPSVLVCPADERTAASDFGSLQNSNVSYFVAIDADYNQALSILAGDANLVTSSPTILRAEIGSRLRWNGQQHQFKGNLLFADGHVEEWGNHSTGNAIISRENFVLPIPNPNVPSAATNHQVLPIYTPNLISQPGDSGLPETTVLPPQPSSPTTNAADHSSPTKPLALNRRMPEDIQSTHSTTPLLPPQKTLHGLTPPPAKTVAKNQINDTTLAPNSGDDKTTIKASIIPDHATNSQTPVTNESKITLTNDQNLMTSALSQKTSYWWLLALLVFAAYLAWKCLRKPSPK